METHHALKPATQTLLRRYYIKPGEWEGFLDVWRRVAKIRRRFGFKILFALVDEQENVFTWAISYDGDIDEVHERYYRDPERVPLGFIADYVLDAKITAVRQEPVPW